MNTSATRCSAITWWLFSFVTIITVTSTSSKQYRKDYEYNENTDAFYKFHTEPEKHDRAKVVCGFEGASLMVPRSPEDLLQAHGMLKRYADVGDFAWIGNDVIQLNAFEKKAFDYLKGPNANGSGEECHVIRRDGEKLVFDCHTPLPFICMVDAEEAFEDTKCKVFGRGYKYFESTGSCYKIPPMAYSWNGAYAECRAENAHLIILNSELEHQVIHDLIHEKRTSIDNAQAFFFFLAGIRAERENDGSPIVFKTIFNQTLEEAGYSQWAENEPNNALHDEYCGTIFLNDGKYNDIACSDPFGFICEKEVQKTE